MIRKNIFNAFITALIISVAAVPASLAQGHPEGAGNELVVCLMGDPQLGMVPETPRYVDIAMDDLMNLDHEFVAVLGDLVQNRADLYTEYMERILERSEEPVFSLAGNADVGAGLSAYTEATGRPLYYSIYRRGIRFIFLSTLFFSGNHNHICHLGSDQLSWLRGELEADTAATTILFSHPPIFETTWHSEERDHLDPPGSMYLSESPELRKLFGEHPNVKVYAHGHLHHTYGVTDEYGRGDYYREGNVLHISVGATANNKGSSFLFIHENNITVRVRDHANQTWKEDCEYHYLVQTTLD
jgi:hypothetical protein